MLKKFTTLFLEPGLKLTLPSDLILQYYECNLTSHGELAIFFQQLACIALKQLEFHFLITSTQDLWYSENTRAREVAYLVLVQKRNWVHEYIYLMQNKALISFNFNPNKK